MTESKEVHFCKQLLYMLGRNEKSKLLEKSNLNERELAMFKARFVQGKTTQEVADDYNIALDTFNKVQRKAFKKLYLWLQFQYKTYTGAKYEN